MARCSRAGFCPRLRGLVAGEPIARQTRYAIALDGEGVGLGGGRGVVFGALRLVLDETREQENTVLYCTVLYCTVGRGGK